MKLSFLRLVVLVLSTFMFVSCNKEEEQTLVDSNQNVELNLRKDFLSNKNFETIKRDFNQLNEKEKTMLWCEKLRQLIVLDLPIEHKVLIKNLLNELSTGKYNHVSFANTALEIAKITPEEDFILMFCFLEDYNFSGKFIGKKKVSNDIINDLNSIKYDKVLASTNDLNKMSVANRSLPDCNCNWSCSFFGRATRKCNVTQSGCGFLWAFECEYHVREAPSEPAREFDLLVDFLLDELIEKNILVNNEVDKTLLLKYLNDNEISGDVEMVTNIILDYLVTNGFVEELEIKELRN